ncbi:bifunctional helix-turn-helix transcriptional regulator/GNAT family N-acetyltransferase [Rhizobium bangladeshense]|uniref:MarR family transcriptional regulator n=1 Tax=Rhizobium bangladeshense TaxID=1138189 RepID=A0ABS7LBT0_9HYPH|nr:bifunctional helix-turn-helix transcriptional regulator/GNAT family N-acetyltransferase [Rhizobium bangladeshense]MBX4866946.1 MarR family transcriptional regulator [Rhizobium bangladeshense]MBX4874126.1 MarR family transcriptional regulator [Rhizobium bangladeshense]MBX4883638.1 MarR family transcriptional regulator [Rhizobium bangladeshense]MBX4888675.1 MarR family transcriptional regulator [Rhizobium bangladeshense]MBX4896664.1 MarR family transcriptional regulator [Rhizobium bangladeshe
MPDVALIETARDFNRFYTNFLGLLNKAYLDSPYTLTDARVLFEIGSHEGVSAKALARDLHLDPAYLSRILKRFRAEGLIETSADTADLRSQIITVTDRGREEFEELGRRANDQIAARFDMLAAGEPQAVVSAMNTIRALLDPTAKPAPAIIRAHRAGDIGWIVESQGRFYAEEYGWDLRFEGLVAEVAGKFLANFDPEKEYCWIAERGGVNVGSVLVTDGGDGVAKLRLLYVDKSARGLGLGKLLVGECIRFARQKGYRQLSLWTNDMLDTARAIYIKAGFELVSEERHSMFGPEANGQTWVLDL